MKRLFELSGNIRFSTVVLAETGEQALAYINDNFSGEGLVTTPGNADILDVSDLEVVDVCNVPKTHKGSAEKILTDFAHHIAKAGAK